MIKLKRVKNQQSKEQSQYHQPADDLNCRCGHPYSRHRSGLYADGGRCKVAGCECIKFMRGNPDRPQART